MKKLSRFGYVLVALAMLVVIGGPVTVAYAACWKLQNQACEDCITITPGIPAFCVSNLFMVCELVECQFQEECPCDGTVIILNSNRSLVVHAAIAGKDNFEVAGQVDCAQVSACELVECNILTLKCDTEGPEVVWTCLDYRLIGNDCPAG